MTEVKFCGVNKTANGGTMIDNVQVYYISACGWRKIEFNKFIIKENLKISCKKETIF